MIGELVVLAAAFAADQAAAVATFGAAEAAVVLLEEAAKRLVDYLEQQLVQYVIGQVVEAAIDPLIATVAGAVTGLVFEAAESAPGMPGGGGGSSFRIDPDALEANARAMHDHAETVGGPCADVPVQDRGGELRMSNQIVKAPWNTARRNRARPWPRTQARHSGASTAKPATT